MKNIWNAMLVCGMLIPSLGFAQSADVPEGIWVRPGYELSVAISDIEGARFMKLTPDGTLFVSLPRAGEIKACKDINGDGLYEKITTFVSGHPTAHGMYWHDGWLWFTQTQHIQKARDTDGDGIADETVEVIGDDELEGGRGHWWRSILIHNNKIYTNVGDRGNIAPPLDDWKRKAIWTYDLDGSNGEIFCTGLRNTEKLVVRPGTEEIWGMDHNSDWFGQAIEGKKSRGDRDIPQPFTDIFPHEEMNHYKKGEFYGHPYIVGLGLPRYEYMEIVDMERDEEPLSNEELVELGQKTVTPEWLGTPHAAANAMEFYTGDQFPRGKGHAFVTYHGSWNRTKKVGYSVTRVLFEFGKPYGEQAFVSMVTEEEEVLGRPVDVAVEKDGSLLISDDGEGRIYRLRYVGGE